MAKGQAIGAGAGAARRGMLPPTGGAPIEVTREFVEREAVLKAGEDVGVQPAPELALPAQTPVVVPAVEARPAVVPAGELPPDTAPAAEIASRCEQLILGARIELEEQVQRATVAWLSKVGPAVRLVHRTRAYKHIADANGRPYRSFERWAQERCGISRPHAYRIVSEGPVAEALAPLYAGPLVTRQVDVLAPVLRQHGAEAVRRVWEAAAATGKTGAVQLAVKRDVLALMTRAEDDEPVKTAARVEPSAVLAQVQRAVADRAVLRQAAIADPDGARSAVTAALRFASDLQRVLDEVSAPAVEG